MDEVIYIKEFILVVLLVIGTVETWTSPAYLYIIAKTAEKLNRFGEVLHNLTAFICG